MGILGEWLFILGELESTGNYFRGAREQAHNFGDISSLAKKDTMMQTYMHEGVWFRKNNFLQNDSYENLGTFSLIRPLYMHRWADQLLPQILMEHFDTSPIQYRHIEHMHEGVWLSKNNF